MMLKVKWFRQKTDFCGPATLKMVLDYFGVKTTENKLAEISGCTPNKGTSAEGMLRAASKYGLKGFVKDFSDFNDVKKYVHERKIPVIVDWFYWNDGHYSVVVDISNTYIFLRDPKLKSVRKMDIETFKRVWFDFENDFLQSKDELIIRRMIVLYSKKN